MRQRPADRRLPSRALPAERLHDGFHRRSAHRATREWRLTAIVPYRPVSASWSASQPAIRSSFSSRSSRRRSSRLVQPGGDASAHAVTCSSASAVASYRDPLSACRRRRPCRVCRLPAGVRRLRDRGDLTRVTTRVLDMCHRQPKTPALADQIELEPTRQPSRQRRDDDLVVIAEVDSVLDRHQRL